MTKVEEAVLYAAISHAGVRRKGKSTPKIDPRRLTCISPLFGTHQVIDSTMEGSLLSPQRRPPCKDKVIEWQN